jgi:hypothetical protein
MQWIPAKIANARKGDLILCSDDGTGQIGALLLALNAPQTFSHMGVMVDDYLTIRHSTMSPDRMTDPFFAVGPQILGTPLPIDGFEAGVVRIGWPGTITQSVDEAFRASNPGVVDPMALPHGVSLTSIYRSDRDNQTTSPEQLIKHSQQDSSFYTHMYAMNELSFNTVFGPLGDQRPCLVVSPCPEFEQAYPFLRSILHNIADEVRGINGHYRFFAYTKASISQEPSYSRPGPTPVYAWDAAQLKWVPNENMAFDPANPCAPSTIFPVLSTVPVVCSSLPWLAVQNFNARQQNYRITLTAVQDVPGCPQVVTANMAGLVPDPQSLTLDGLYYFTAQDRAQAAAVLNASIQQVVKNTVAKEWGKIGPEIQQVTNEALPGLAEILGVLEAAPVPVAIVATLLNIALNTAATLVDLFTNMPAHIANQVCNTFAFDNPDPLNEQWKQPGVGRAVGPEDIVWFWGPTTMVTPPTLEATTQVQGLYGQNQPLILRQPGMAMAPGCVWTLSPGPGKFAALAVLGPGGSPVAFALIDIACNQGFTNSVGEWFAEIPAGKYWASASFQDSSGVLWSVQEVVTVLFGQATQHTFTLLPPPLDWREVDCGFTAECFPGQVQASGNPINVGWLSGCIPLGPKGVPLIGPQNLPIPNSQAGLSGTCDSGGVTYSGDHQVGINVTANLGTPGTGNVSGVVIAYQLQSGQTESSPNHRWVQQPFGPIAPGVQESFVFNISTGGLLPDVINGTITIVNNQGYPPAA